MRLRASLLLRLLVCLPVAGCGDPGGEAWRVQTGDPVTLLHEPQLEVCGGTLGYLDDSARAIAAATGRPLPAAIPYHYARTISGPCRNQHAEGCTRRAPLAIWARSPTVTHELVHALQDHLGPSFLMEGEAVALGSTAVFSAPYLDLPDEALLGAPALAPEHYGTAGDLVSYLVTRHGMPPFQRLVRELPAGAAPAEIQGAFQRIYGLSFSELRRERRAWPHRFAENRLWIPECRGVAAVPLPAHGGRFDASVSCSGSAIGAGGETAGVHRTLEVEAAGLYTLAAQVPDGAALRLHLCDGHGPLLAFGAQAQLAPGQAQIVGHLSRARHLLTFGAATASQPAELSATLAPLPPAAACNAPGAPLAIAPGTGRLLLFSLDRQSYQVAFQVDRDRRVAGLARMGQASSGVQLCLAGCGGPCQELSPVMTVPLSPGTVYGVRADFADAGGSAGLAFF